jgi:hypothetical protein
MEPFSKMAHLSRRPCQAMDEKAAGRGTAKEERARVGGGSEGILARGRLVRRAVAQQGGYISMFMTRRVRTAGS